MVVGPGDQPGVMIGPLIDDRGVDKADEHVRDAVAQRRRASSIGGDRLTDGEYARGSFYAPTVLDGVTAGHADLPRGDVRPRRGRSRGSRPRTRRSGSPTTRSTASAAYFHTRDYARLLRVAERLEYGIVGANAGIISAPQRRRSAASRSRATGARAARSGIDEYLDVKYVLVADVEGA